MVPRARLSRWCSGVLLALLGAQPVAAIGDEVPSGRVRLDFEGDVQPAGDVAAKVTIRFPRVLYQQIKQSSPDARRFLQSFGSRRVDYEVAPNPIARYDDVGSSVVLELTQLGAARALGDGRWELDVDAESEIVARTTDPTGRTLVHYYLTSPTEEGGLLAGPLRVRLPRGAEDVQVDPERHVVLWRLPEPSGKGAAQVRFDVRARDRLMGGIYKVYGLRADFAAQWVGKAVVKNHGASIVRDLAVRWRVEGYSEWSPWQKHPVLVPGQTVVCVYYPVLSAAVANLSSNTPATMHVEWSYRDGAGAVHADTDGRPLVLLGGHEFVFSSLTPEESFGTWKEALSNAPFLAAWVSRDDPAVKQFAAMANRRAGGVGAGQDEQSAAQVLLAIYDLMLANDITYQHPPTLTDRSVSFDPQRVQNVKHPRDVLRDRSGTCLDLAVFMASVGHAVGLQPLLAVVPGHAFPVFRLPGGNLIGIESTGVRGGLRFGSLDFAKALEIGTQELRDWKQDGRIQLVDVQDLWSRGVSSPELEALPADVLERWGIREQASGAPEPPDATTSATCSPAHQPFAGRWESSIEFTWNRVALRWPTVLTIDCRTDGRVTADFRARGGVPTRQGAAVEAEIQETLVGAAERGVLRLKGEAMNVRAVSDGSTVKLPGDTLELSLVQGRLVGKFMEKVDVTFTRR